MLKFFIRAGATVLMILFFSPPLYAQDALGSLSLPVGARAMALGEAWVGEASDALSSYWNPAGLSQVKGNYLATMHQEIKLLVPYDYLGYLSSSGKGKAFGFNFICLDYSALGYTWQEDAYIFSYADAYSPRLSWGVNLKHVRLRVPDTGSGRGWGADLGVLYKMGKNLKVGAMFRNAYALIQYAGFKETQERHLTLGLSFKPDLSSLLVLDFSDLLNRCDSNSPPALHLGLERQLGESFSLRVGYLHSWGEEGEKRFTAGVGITLEPWQIDYAYDPTKNIHLVKDSQRISATYKLK